MNFNISDKVVCIDDTPRHGTIEGLYEFPNGFVVKDEIYCVEEVVTIDFNNLPSCVCLKLVGKPIFSRIGEVEAWPHNRFRKLNQVSQTEKKEESNLALV